MKKEELIRVIDKIVERKVQQQITKLKEEIFIDKEKPLSVESIKEEFVQKPRQGCVIKGAPIGCDFDIGQDYSFGKFEKTYEA